MCLEVSTGGDSWIVHQRGSPPTKPKRCSTTGRPLRSPMLQLTQSFRAQRIPDLAELDGEARAPAHRGTAPLELLNCQVHPFGVDGTKRAFESLAPYKSHHGAVIRSPPIAAASGTGSGRWRRWCGPPASGSHRHAVRGDGGGWRAHARDRPVDASNGGGSRGGRARLRPRRAGTRRRASGLVPAVRPCNIAGERS